MIGFAAGPDDKRLCVDGPTDVCFNSARSDFDRLVTVRRATSQWCQRVCTRSGEQEVWFDHTACSHRFDICVLLV